MGMKYIVLQIRNGETVREWPIIFPDMMVHRQVAQWMGNLLEREHNLKPKVIAAGSISFFGGKVHCTGESETLNLESRGSEDENLIKMLIICMGYCDD